MKLYELLETVSPEQDATFEIIEATYPTGIFVKDILVKYPYAKDYQVVSVGTGIYSEDGEDKSTLMIEVSDGEQEGS